MPPSQYATIADLSLRVNSAVMEDPIFDVVSINRMLQASSALADAKLASQFKLPLLSWGEDLVDAVCQMTHLMMLRKRGFDEEKGGDVAGKKAADDAAAWLVKVGKGDETPALLQDSSPASVPGTTPGRTARVLTGPQRGLSSYPGDDWYFSGFWEPPGDD